VSTVPPAELGPWSAGVLGPLVVVGASVCVLSWPPRFDPPADSEDPESPPRPRWRFAYLTPLVVTAVAAPGLVADPIGGLPPAGAVGLLLLLACTALLLGAAVFLVVLLPLGQLVGWWRSRLEGRRTSPYVPLGALLVRSLAAVGTCTGVAFDGLPTGPFGLALAALGLVGIRPDWVVVAHPAWLLGARLSALVLVLVVVGFVVQGRRPEVDDTYR
jgi:hypothetical protein